MSSSGLLSSRTPRRVAVIGGSRIPSARWDAAYAACSNQEMLSAGLDLISVCAAGGQGVTAVPERA
jgi:acetyl-CoA C-acetyltransferase